MAVSPLSASARIHSDHLAVAAADGTVRRYLHLWLRDNCPCEDCRHPGNGQRIVDTAVIPADVRPTSAQVHGEWLDIGWNDGHRSRFGIESLTQPHPPTTGPRTLWTAADAPLTPLDGGRVMHSDAALETMLSQVNAKGYARITGLPPEPGVLPQLVDRFGQIRETNYGRVFDVRTQSDPTNLAYTGLGLAAHTDNPYREPPPAIQLLHCIRSSSTGGETILVDGFAVAERMRRGHATMFSLLRRVPVTFTYRDAVTTLRASAPVIECDPGGEVQAIRYNTRSARPFDLGLDLTRRYYAAYQRFGTYCADPRLAISFALAPGDAVVMDNARLLHGRTPIVETGVRHLQGCHCDRDGLRSTLWTLQTDKEQHP